ncbi:hypothetical protein [Nocardia altamirensis]|uniref:hypothetical protein n=1 Tax=Nocardia altamirensis TaxID=472158 RepID=UPI0008402CC3|nr:hypothetical protein [Nocardia altamirensis]
MEVTPSLYGETLYVPGFDGILKTEYDAGYNTLRLVVGYNLEKITEIHRIRVSAGPLTNNGAWQIGPIRVRDGWQNFFYTQQFLRNGSWIAIDPPAA